MAALEAEIRSTKDALSSQPVVDELRTELAQTQQAYQDLQASLEFSLKEHHFAARMYNKQIAGLRSELATSVEAKESLIGTLYSMEVGKSHRGCGPAMPESHEIASLISQRNEANARLEDLSDSTMALVQAYNELQAERDGLVAQLRNVRKFYAESEPTPGAGLSFTLPSPLAHQGSRSASASPEVSTPELLCPDIRPHPLAKSWTATCGSLDVFGYSLQASFASEP